MDQTPNVTAMPFCRYLNMISALLGYGQQVIFTSRHAVQFAESSEVVLIVNPFTALLLCMH